MFLTHDAQRTYVRALLGEIYPGAPQVGMHIGFPVLRSVLGITCTYSSSFRGSRSAGWMSRQQVPSDKKMQPNQILEVLFRVFSYLLTLQPALVIVENMELCDEDSMKVLLELAKLTTSSGFLLTALTEANGAEDSTPTRTFFHTRASYHHEQMKSAPWSRQYCALIENHKSVTALKLTNYTPEEIDKMLCAALNITTVPPEISQLVQDFSGGSYFWVREILQFIKEHGADQFMSAIGEKEQSNNINVYATIEDLQNRPKLKHTTSMAAMNASPKKGASTRQLGKNASFRAPTANRVAAHPHQVQLDKLVLCRFGNLSTDMQRILRTASILGMTFSGTVLHGVLVPQLRHQLAQCFESLLNQRWLYQDADNETMYQFAHPHAHQIIYELTPPSERTTIHQQIANHMEKIYRDDKSQYGLLSFHYQQCDSDKALMYAAKAIDVLLQVNSIYDFGDCLDLLSGSVACCRTTHDVDAMMVLVNRARIAIREYNLVAPVAAPQSFLGRLLAVFTGFGPHVPHRIAPGDDEKYMDFHVEDVHPYGSGSGESLLDDGTVSTRSGNSRSSHGRSSAGMAGTPTNSRHSTQSDVLAEEKRAKRMLLQQVSRLYDDLSEKYVDVAEGLGAAATDEMKEWQKELLGQR
jgi:hypothetical protein